MRNKASTRSGLYLAHERAQDVDPPFALFPLGAPPDTIRVVELRLSSQPAFFRGRHPRGQLPRIADEREQERRVQTLALFCVIDRNGARFDEDRAEKIRSR